jgi:hypothetical protein
MIGRRLTWPQIWRGFRGPEHGAIVRDHGRSSSWRKCRWPPSSPATIFWLLAKVQHRALASLWNVARGKPESRSHTFSEADDDLGAMLLERCQPGDMLRSEPEHKQDEVIASLHRFRHLSEMLEGWRYETVAQAQHWPDARLMGEGLRLLQALAQPLPTDTLLATDLHAGNVLRFGRAAAASRKVLIMAESLPGTSFAGHELAIISQHDEEALRGSVRGMQQRTALYYWRPPLKAWNTLTTGGVSGSGGFHAEGPRHVRRSPLSRIGFGAEWWLA